MMSLTHIAFGMAVTLSFRELESPLDFAFAISAGAVGSVLADIDVIKSNKRKDALLGQSVAAILLAFTVAANLLKDRTVIRQLTRHSAVTLVGSALFVIFCIIGVRSPHRGFTHSVVGMALFSAALYMIYPLFGVLCLYGYLSHILLDLFNKRGLRLFWPCKKRVCLGAYKVDGAADKVFRLLGFALSAAALIVRAYI